MPPARPASDGILQRLRWPLLGIALVFVLGLTGYLALGLSPLDALTNTILVLTTVGFAVDAPLTAPEKVLTLGLALLGVTAYLALLAVAAAALAEGQFATLQRRRRMERRVATLRDHYVVCAYGRVGRTVARELAGAGARFVVIDRLESLEEQMRADGVPYLIGDPTSEDVLRRARIDRARGLVSAVDSDADNVYITLTARSLNPDLFVVSRGAEAAAVDRLYRAGADRVISPYVSSGRHMALLALRPRIVDYLEIRAPDGRPLRLEEIAIEEGSHLVGSPLEAACGEAVPLVLRRESGEVVTAPPADERLAAGDLVVLLGAPEALRHAEEEA